MPQQAIMGTVSQRQKQIGCPLNTLEDRRYCQRRDGPRVSKMPFVPLTTGLAFPSLLR
jgi:hypothetical protein